ncbi:MAG: hypothetical protein KGL39_58280 [Patescibacteria group bacterium]|nr:hypothetical protein [Patescibacteria group bacterium]
MLCYKDQTFCSAECATEKCPVRYTDEIRADARKWWGRDGAPICVANLSRQCAFYEPVIDTFSSELEDIYDEPEWSEKPIGGAE